MSLSVVIPVFNRDPEIVNYVINDMLLQDIDEIIISNTGEKRLNYDHPRVREVWVPLPIFYPGITRNMGAVVANSRVQVHTGADIITISGTWSEFRELDDGATARTQCALLNAAMTEQALLGKRVFSVSYHRTVTAVYGMTKRTALEILKGPYDWEMRRWGWVDIDVNRRVVALKLKHKVLSLKTAHLHHDSGYCTHAARKKTPDCIYNSGLRDAKSENRGWWSELPAATEARV